ncbi:hypothetical protein FC97_GL001436 [Companilactobacillus kimchii DSM 13961 = JCM 10707]|uniref:Band 7 domain-containing protein n=1 Tax=Companilactobacillus kimchii DSM 13961 = JCM 10707 TaxID=1423765 RepID=A0ABR5NRA4_9LACO|nr:hypothetical protein FC97_GL001436 [Companilactobacillus kimchii DSM 13961 = JCM 10707]
MRQNHVGLVETLGRYKREVNAGLSFYIPIFQKVRIVDLAMIPLSLKGYSVITKDNAEVQTAVRHLIPETPVQQLVAAVLQVTVVNPHMEAVHQHLLTVLAVM